jgi:DNA-binding transcriptional LysR family regulator
VRLRHIEVFNAIMLTGTVSAAAKLLNLSQPAVTNILKAAEQQLGYSLFDRVRGRLIPSEEALALAPDIERLNQHLNEVRTMAANLKRRDIKQFRVLAPPAFAQVVLPHAVIPFLRRHPQSQLTMRSQYSRQVLESLVRREAELGFVYHSNSHPAIAEEDVSRGELVCIAPKGVFKTKRSVRMGELARYPVINLDPDDLLGQLIADSCKELGVKFSTQLSVQAYHALLSFVTLGFGIGFVDSFTASSADRRLVDTLSFEPKIEFSIKAVYPITAQRSQIVRELIRSVARSLQASTWRTPEAHSLPELTHP